MLDLEQFIGKEITWLTGRTFDEIIIRKDKKYLPNVMQRFCTIEMKLDPINKWWWDNVQEVVEMRLGFRANETKRATNMLKRCDADGIILEKFIIGKRNDGKNKWKQFPMRKPAFPLIEDGVYKDTIVDYWAGKEVRFAFMNNCVGCFHRNELLLNKMSQIEPTKMQWFVDAEQENGETVRTFKKGITYEKIKNHKLQTDLFEDDFNECDSGYCGL